MSGTATTYEKGQRVGVKHRGSCAPRTRGIGTTVAVDVHNQLCWLADDMGTTVSDLTRMALVMVVAYHGEAPPESLAHLLTERDREYLLRCGVPEEDLPACTDIGSTTCTDSEELAVRTDKQVQP